MENTRADLGNVMGAKVSKDFFHSVMQKSFHLFKGGRTGFPDLQ